MILMRIMARNKRRAKAGAVLRKQGARPQWSASSPHPIPCFSDCNWTSGIKNITDYMLVLCQKLHILLYDQLNFPAWQAPLRRPLAPTAPPKVEVLEPPPAQKGVRLKWLSVAQQRTGSEIWYLRLPLLPMLNAILCYLLYQQKQAYYWQ